MRETKAKKVISVRGQAPGIRYKISRHALSELIQYELEKISAELPCVCITADGNDYDHYCFDRVLDDLKKLVRGEIEVSATVYCEFEILDSGTITDIRPTENDGYYEVELEDGRRCLAKISVIPK